MMTSLFAVLPYVKTKDPFYVAGVSFRNSQNTQGLTDDETENLKSIISLFYLADDNPITEVTYAVIRLSSNHEEANKQVQQLRAAHTILSYIVTRDDYDSYEQTMLYLLVPAEVFDDKSFVPGYSVTVNWLYWVEIPRGRRIYPPQPYPVAFIPQGWNLSDIPQQLESRRYAFYGLEGFVKGEILDKPEQRDRYDTLLQAMSWYNRSFSQFITGEERIVHIAIAFEILFHQRESSQQAIREELKSHLRGLFGKAKRLNEWVDQFYTARSNILHEGSTAKFNFIIGEKQPTERQLVMDSLVSYGRRLLRMCILNILHGTALVEEANLNAWFVHDRERLDEICRILRQADVPAERKLLSVVSLLYDLGDNWLDIDKQKSIEIKSIFGTGKLLITTYLEAYPDIEEKISQKLGYILDLPLDNPLALADSYSELENELKRGVSTYEGKLWPRQPRQALAYFAKYASSPHLKLRIYSAEGEKRINT